MSVQSLPEKHKGQEAEQGLSLGEGLWTDKGAEGHVSKTSCWRGSPGGGDAFVLVKRWAREGLPFVGVSKEPME